jgi:HK97 family phage major capsid protein
MAKVVVPTAPDELEDFLSDPARVKALMAEGEFGTFISNYIENVAQKDKGLKAQVQEQVQIGIAEFMAANGGQVKKVDFSPKAVNSAGPARALDNPKANGAPLNGLFPDWYSFLQATWPKGNKSQEIKDKLQTVMDYSEQVPAEGGFLVPEEFRSQIMRLMLPNQVVRPRATVIPMGSPRLHVPKIDETSRVSSVFGGVVVYRTAEGQELTESAAAFASTKLDVTKQTALSHVPNELIRDWGAFGAFMDATLPAALGFYEDVDFLSGNGAGAPLGALSTGNTALVVPARSSSNHIVWEDVLHMFARLLPQSMKNAVWLAGQDSFFELATMALTVGTGGSAVWLTDGHGAPQLTLLGLPVILDSDKAPSALGTQGDLSLVDFSFYLVGDYQTMSVDSSEHVKFTSDKTTFRLIARNDGRPWLDAPLTPKNGSATLSPFVQLAT